MQINGRWYSETELEAYVITLEHKVATLEDKHWSECRQISEYQAENEALKKLTEKYADVCEGLCFTVSESGGCEFCPYGKNDPCVTDILGEEYLKLVVGDV